MIKDGEPFGKFKEYGEDGKIIREGNNKGFKSMKEAKKSSSLPNATSVGQKSSLLKPNYRIRYLNVLEEIIVENNGVEEAAYEYDTGKLKRGRDILPGINGEVAVMEYFGDKGYGYGVTFVYNGKRNGQITYYYDTFASGKVLAIINYDYGIIEGKAITYHRNGRVAEESEVRDGEIISYHAYDENGIEEEDY